MLHEYDISCDEGIALPLPQCEIEDIFNLVLDEEGVGRPCMLSLSFVSDERIAELNSQWRGQNKPTDVISLECEHPDDPDVEEGVPVELGDIVIAPAYVARQADFFGTTAADECRMLLVHGLLHLLGYDHLEDVEAEEMEAREDELLQLIHTDGDLARVNFTRHADEGVQMKGTDA